MSNSPPLFGNGDLPGPLCLNMMSEFGTLCKLDNVNAYSQQDSHTLFGRATIIASVLPYHTVACAGTAAWVWLGGTFPETIDVIANAHFRTPRHGRKIRVYNRRLLSNHVIRVGPIQMTTPVRTACDLATIYSGSNEGERLAQEVISMLMQEYHFRPSDCQLVLQETRHIRNAPSARRLFLALDGKS